MSRNEDTTEEERIEMMEESLEKIRPLVRDMVEEHGKDAILHDWANEEKVEYLMARQDHKVKEVAEDAPHRVWELNDDNIEVIEFHDEEDAERVKRNIRSAFGTNAHFKTVKEVHERTAGRLWMAIRDQIDDPEIRSVSSWDFTKRAYVVTA